jgi:hypothetical protein
MPDTMIERVARAMIADMNEYDGVADADVDGWQLPSVREIYIRQARAAIAALMEPTDGMVEAADRAMYNRAVEGERRIPVIRDGLRAAIAAALEETPDA